MRRVPHKRQFTTTIPNVPTGIDLTGSQILASTAPVDSVSLLLGTAAGPDATTPPIATNALTTTPPLSSPSTSESSATSSSSTSSSISLGAVIGICVGVFAGLSAVLVLIFCMGSRRRLEKQARMKQSENDVGRRKSGREMWVKMEDKGSDEKYEKYAMKRTTQISTVPSSTVGSPTTVERSITVKSVKSTRTFKSLGYGAGLGLSNTFKTPEMPPQLEFTDSDIGTGHGFTRTAMPPFARVQEAAVSWDGETIAEGDSYLSLKRESDQPQFAHVNSPMGSSIVVSHQTPPAVETSLHKWEEAEVVSPEGAEDAYGGVEESQHQPRKSEETIHGAARLVTQSSRDPFLDSNPFEDPSTSHSNPPPPSSATTDSFFSVNSKLSERSDAFGKAAAVVNHHARMDSNEHAMASLIAALDISPQEAQERLSAAVLPTPRVSTASAASFGVQSFESRTSEATDVARYGRFPLPPTDIELHNEAP
ncbi:hypothetical protein EW145_g3466 [Phellinidium pouzarii]|uniref:Mid2 domain-containing protein n=1 Tax=Phellinidium pouzarii TaxID=167371 RepID=A0A4S4L714_9AGAM|nr:hypothetical protein EW145_g3466 [Phellinidium pouzarii]